MTRIKIFLKTFTIILFLFLPTAVWADVETFTISIRAHKFYPSELTIPSNQKIKLIIINEDSSPEEFESYDLNREKVVAAHGKISLFIGPLKPGTYKYFGEFNQATAQGVIQVKQ